MPLITLAEPTPRDLDFWVGKWKMASHSRKSYESEEFEDGTAQNTVVKGYGGKLIEENFSTKGFKGRSWSVFNARTKQWNQTWVDDGGSYLLFRGGKQGDRFILNMTNGAPGRQMRMVFSKIQKDSFVWDWEQSRDGGKSWRLMWELKYKRVA
ncbi:hypothetical protein EON82_06055 [bacterium]|nr:MAG: hypothetical protein EON82_06055 [bacterium]